MRIAYAAIVFIFPAILFAQGASAPIDSLIKKLGSADFRERQAATDALKKRPDALPDLRKAIQTADREVANRAAEIIDYLERSKIAEIHDLVKSGAVEKAIQEIAAHPHGKQEKDLWEATCKLAETLDAEHQKRGGKKLETFADRKLWPNLPLMIHGARVSDPTRFEELKNYFVRGGEVDLDFSKHRFRGGSLAVMASGPVRVGDTSGVLINVFARQSVEIRGGFFRAIIVSGGDVTLQADVIDSLIIARGTITVDKDAGGNVFGSRVIAGKSALGKRYQQCMISENDSNPLGFIRWADAPKDKPAPKSK